MSAEKIGRIRIGATLRLTLFALDVVAAVLDERPGQDVTLADWHSLGESSAAEGGASHRGGCRRRIVLMGKLFALWSGHLALDEAFWTWAVTLGLLINIATSILFWILLLRDQPLAALVAGYAVAVPYNVVATVGVWRSAARYAGPPFHADLARFATVID